MLKVKDGIKLEELEKFGFEKEYIFADWAYQKEYREGGEYKEHIIVWCNEREIQVKAIEILDTLYDLITAGIVVKE